MRARAVQRRHTWLLQLHFDGAMYGAISNPESLSTIEVVWPLHSAAFCEFENARRVWTKTGIKAATASKRIAQRELDIFIVVCPRTEKDVFQCALPASSIWRKHFYTSSGDHTEDWNCDQQNPHEVLLAKRIVQDLQWVWENLCTFNDSSEIF